MSTSRQFREARGQASVEFVAVVPLILLGVLVLLQFGLAGWTYWSVGVSARVAARTAYVGGDAGSSARASLPEPLRDSSRADEAGGGAWKIGARPPSLLPTWLTPRIWARSGFGAGDG